MKPPRVPSSSIIPTPEPVPSYFGTEHLPLTSPAVLFNCCEQHEPPDWAQFNWLEIWGCLSEFSEDGIEIVTGGLSEAEASFFAIFGHYHLGGLEALTDCPTLDRAWKVAEQLELLSGLHAR